jgi:AraC-like DNA-binding protein
MKGATFKWPVTSAKGHHKIYEDKPMTKQNNNPFLLALKARNLTVEIHHHSAYQIVLSYDTPFNSTIKGKLYEGIHGFLIKPHVPHFCVAEKGTLNVLNIEPYSNIGLQLARRFEETHDYIVDALFANVPATAYDNRVAKIVAYIKTNYFEQNITPQTFADIVFLSPSRLAALFKEQTGSSLSKYLLWTRLRQAIYLTLAEKDRSLTDIAYNSGFYDLPQFNKYMYEMFGMPPKALKHNSDLIEIYQFPVYP